MDLSESKGLAQMIRIAQKVEKRKIYVRKQIFLDILEKR